MFCSKRLPTKSFWIKQLVACSSEYPSITSSISVSHVSHYAVLYDITQSIVYRCVMRPFIYIYLVFNFGSTCSLFYRVLSRRCIICVQLLSWRSCTVSACLRAAGMEVGFIIDAQISASSHIPGSEPGRSRLNETYGTPSKWMTPCFVAITQQFHNVIHVDVHICTCMYLMSGLWCLSALSSLCRVQLLFYELFAYDVWRHGA